MSVVALGLATILAAATPASALHVPSDTTASAVVQRFVDAANAARLDDMMAAVAPDVVFARLPNGDTLASGRDSVRAMYARMFARLPPGFLVRVAQRLPDRAYVVDHEVFVDGQGASQGEATWIYLVTEGLIQRAWILVQQGTKR